MLNEDIIKGLAKTIEELVSKSSINQFLFKGKISKIEKGGKILVKVHDQAIISALILMFGNSNHHEKTEIKDGDDVIILKTQNAGNFAIPIQISADGQKGIYLKIEGVSFYEVILEDFEQIREGLEKTKTGFEAIKNTSASASVEPALKAVGEAVSPAIEGLAQVIASINKLNNKIKKIV